MAEPVCVSLDAALAYLNELNTLDPTVFPALMRHRVPCNSDFAYHPTVQVGADGDLPAGYDVGILGILNGLFGVDTDDWGFITAVVSSDGDRVEWFERTPPRRAVPVADHRHHYRLYCSDWRVCDCGAHKPCPRCRQAKTVCYWKDGVCLECGWPDEDIRSEAVARG